MRVEVNPEPLASRADDTMPVSLTYMDDSLWHYLNSLSKASPRLGELSKSTIARRGLAARNGVLHGLHIASFIGEALGFAKSDIPVGVLRTHAALYCCVIVIDDILDGFADGTGIPEILDMHVHYCIECLPDKKASWEHAARTYAARWIDFEAKLRDEPEHLRLSDQLAAKCALLWSTIDAFGLFGTSKEKLKPIYSWIDAGVCANAMADDIDDVPEDIGASKDSSYLLHLVRRNQRVPASATLTINEVRAALSQPSLLTEYLADLRRHIARATVSYSKGSGSDSGKFMQSLLDGAQCLEADMAEGVAVPRILAGADYFAST